MDGTRHWTPHMQDTSNAHITETEPPGCI